MDIHLQSFTLPQPRTVIMEQAFSSESSRWINFLRTEIFPPGTAEQRDSHSQSGGFIKGYEINPPNSTPPTPEARPSTQANITLPDIRSFSTAAAAIIKEPFFQAADTIVVLTNTDPLSSKRVMKHFDKLGPVLFDRTTIKGPYHEQWAIAFHQTDIHDD